MIGTGLAIGLALAGMGASTAKDIYAARSANKTNKTALDYQREADAATAANQKTTADAAAKAQADAAKVEADTLAEKKRQYDATQAQNGQRWQDYLRINEPYWQAGSGVLRSLYGLAGMSGNAPAFSMPSGGPPPAAAPGGVPGGTSMDGSAPMPPGMQTASSPVEASARHGFTPMPTPQGHAFDLSTLMALANSSRFGSTPVAGGT